ncbi:MAG: beta-propeller fold lactonase family protein [Fimbriimonadales bacterium]|nr:beta-propeller fold lactonase family protein [Fimbriimonadales bacterium]
MWSRNCLVIALLLAVVSAVGQAAFKTLYVTNNVSGNVTAFRVNGDGSLTTIGVYPAGVNPQDCALTHDGRNLVVLNATAAQIEELYVFRVMADGSLVQLNPPVTVGDGPLSVWVTRNNFALVPSATDDNLTSFLVSNDNLFQRDQKPAGTFPIKVISTPNGDFVYCSGSSAGGNVYKYSIDANGMLTPIGVPTPVTEGSPQGMAVHPNGRILYVSTALGNVVRWFRIESNGELTALGSQNAGGNSCTELAIHPAGNYLYVCNVVSDTLTVLNVHPDGSLSATGQSYAIGNDIRSVETDGRFVYVTDESSIGGSPVGVVVFRINNDGTLTQLGPATPTGGTRPQQMAVWSPVVSVLATGVAITAGVPSGGGLAEILASDNQYLRVREAPPIALGAPSARIEVETSAPQDYASSIEILVETGTSAAPAQAVTMTLDLWDNKTNTWQRIGSSAMTSGDSEHVFEALWQASRFVEPGTGRIRTRIGWLDPGSLFTFGWQVRVDYIEFRVRP